MAPKTKAFCSFVPEEVVEQILARITCKKSIVRCTLVCKLWRSLIKSYQFINTHLSGPNNTKYLLCRSTAAEEYSLYSDSEPFENDRVVLVFPHRPYKRVDVHGCCNGVICYTSWKTHECDGEIYLWNPTIRKLKTLPQPRKTHPNKYCVMPYIGFWFDKEKSDHQVVKITYTTMASSVDVYSLRSNSWKNISDSCPSNPLLSKHNVVYAKGSLHWLTTIRFNQGRMIFSLNMNNGKFRETSIISSALSTVPLCLKLVDPNSLVIFRRKNLHPVCTVKVYDERLELLYTDLDKSVNNNNSVLIYTDLDKSVNNNSGLVGYRNNGDALLKLPNRTIVSYDFRAKQLTDFVLLCKKNVFSVHPFIETLVLLNEESGGMSSALLFQEFGSYLNDCL